MPGGKRRALKKLLKQQQVSELPVYPVETGVSADQFITFSDDEDTAAESAGVSILSKDDARSSVEIVTESATPLETSEAPTPSEASSAGGGIFGNGRGGAKGGKKSSKQRFAERQARKAQAVVDAAPVADAGWNAQLEKERQEEIAAIADACKVLDAEVFEIQPDGHCMFSAVADQLALLGVIPASQANNPYEVRRVAAEFMRKHRDDFLPFLPSVDGEDMPGATDDGLMTTAQFAEYCHRVEKTAEWGGEPEIQALCRAYAIPIHVIQRGPPSVVSHGGADDTFGGAMTPKDSLAAGDRIVRIAYHRRMYGLGEHYNSLRPFKA